MSVSLDPVANLALTLRARPGVYALLLGSGVSSAAAIPTGWQITLDLARRIATAEGAAAEDVETWWQERHGSALDYSDVLEAVAANRDDRRALLHQFIEPDAAERAEGLKQPTAAHRAIARLVASGLIRVIVTTNFDRLLELALQDEGVTPTVIASADASRGAEPLTHARCTILKVHGDYLDTRIRNTGDELAAYEPAIDGLLDRIFDEYGLVVCGWSATWDSALRAAILRAPGRRYTTWWSHRGPLTAEAEALIQARSAVVLPGLRADQLFTSLLDKVEALEGMEGPNPLDVKIAVASAKRWLVDERDRVRLFDLVNDETGRLVSLNVDASRSPSERTTGTWIDRSPAEQARFWEGQSTVLRRVAAQIGHWGTREQIKLLERAISRLAASPARRHGVTHLSAFNIYPAVLVLLAALMGAVAADNYPAVKALLTLVFRKDDRATEVIQALHPRALDYDRMTAVWGSDRSWHPPDDWIERAVLLPDFTWWSAERESVEVLFDDTMLIWALQYAWDTSEGQPTGKSWFPKSNFGWRRRHWAEDRVWDVRFGAAAEQGDEWPPLKAGLFGGTPASFERLWAAMLDDRRTGSRYQG